MLEFLCLPSLSRIDARVLDAVDGFRHRHLDVPYCRCCYEAAYVSLWLRVLKNYFEGPNSWFSRNP